MKKKNLILGTVILSLSLMLTGCQKDDSGYDTDGSALASNLITEINEDNNSEINDVDNKSLNSTVVKDDDVNQLKKPEAGDIVANIQTNKGDIKVKLLNQAAPIAVENFIQLSENGYYNGITFHRVINEFMIQGGDPTGTGMGGESVYGEKFQDEFSDFAKHFNGALSMANSGPNTNGSQFFIVNTGDTNMFDGDIEYVAQSGELPEHIAASYKEAKGVPSLDNVHTVFGQVYEGMDVVQSISIVNTDENDKPLEDIVIKNIDIEKI